MMSKRSTFILLTLITFLFQKSAFSFEPALRYPTLVSRLCDRQPGWLFDPTKSAQVQKKFMSILDSAVYLGLEKEKYHFEELKSATENKILADALISYARDLYCGAEMNRWIINDEISPRYANDDDELIINKLTTLYNADELHSLLTTFEPADANYITTKNELAVQIDSANTNKVRQLAVCLNIQRWIHHFHFKQFIVVNIPSATLNYYAEDNTRLTMKVVVGKPTTRTPRFSAYCNEIILYPYWHVPQSIAIKELLPRIRKNPGVIDKENMQLITKGGKLVNHRNLDWSQYGSRNFPYILRQCTGCDNALGVIKFNLTDPFDVYMHDTNFKTAFGRQSRFLSHGCIRLEKPIELGNYLLEGDLNSKFLQACVEGQKPIIKKLREPVPVFVVYMPATAEDGQVIFHKDIYRLFQ